MKQFSSVPGLALAAAVFFCSVVGAQADVYRGTITQVYPAHHSFGFRADSGKDYSVVASQATISVNGHNDSFRNLSPNYPVEIWSSRGNGHTLWASRVEASNIMTSSNRGSHSRVTHTVKSDSGKSMRGTITQVYAKHDSFGFRSRGTTYSVVAGQGLVLENGKHRSTSSLSPGQSVEVWIGRQTGRTIWATLVEAH